MSAEYDVHAMARIDATARELYVHGFKLVYQAMSDEWVAYGAIGAELAYERAAALEAARSRSLLPAAPPREAKS
jgi:hypothetical protein